MPTLYAALIGINNYPSNKLYGCVKDVIGVDAFLRDYCKQQKDLSYAPAFWLAPHDNEQGIVPQGSMLPTFGNISDRENGPFAHLKMAQSGDICLLYYSGHGSYMDAPEEFWHLKPDRRNETLVCMDSRTTTARDLTDKELAFLIHDALKDPNTQKQKENVHCVVIMDCCHSGNNLRSTETTVKKHLRYRHEPGAKNKIPYTDYLGVKEDFFTVQNGRASFPIARYVHLASARDAEKAQESDSEGGLFTAALLSSLRAGGSAKSYRNLMDTLAVYVSNRAEEQHPVPFARVDEDLDLQFLGNGRIPYVPGFEVHFDKKHGQWMLMGGTQDMLVPSSAHAKTLVRIEGSEKDIQVTEVFSRYSYLDMADMAGFDMTQQYKALLRRLANAKLKIGISDALRKDEDALSRLSNAAKAERTVFFELSTETDKNVDYLVRISDDGAYVLCRPDAFVPIFKREKDAASFLRNVDSVGKWIGASELKNQSPVLKQEDFIFKLERIEGQDFGSYTVLDNRELTKGELFVNEKGEPFLPDEATFSYKKEKQQPAFRLSIEISPDATHLNQCFVAAMYLQSNFMIRTNMIDADQSRLVRGKTPAPIQVVINGVAYTSIPLTLNEAYKAYNINEITAFLKIVVSNKEIDLNRFKQDPLKLDDTPEVKSRGSRGDDELSLEDNLGDDTEWSVFTLKLRVVGPNKEKTLVPGQAVDFAAFSVEAPEGFSATAFAATSADLERAQKISAKRGFDEDSAYDTALTRPPQSIWGETVSDLAPFSKGMNTSSGNDVQVLELPLAEGKSLTLPEGKNLVIRPKANAVKTRSADSRESVTVPFAFDPKRELYFPVGYQDKAGNIQITHLPPPTPGEIRDGEVTKRSIKGSIKIFFKKIFQAGGGNVNALCLHLPDGQGNWEEISDPAKIKAHLQEKRQGKAILVIHGIIGDTLGQVAAFKERHNKHQGFDFLLSYDYENLGNPIDITAKQLKDQLVQIGYDTPGQVPGVYIVAHSMGGLVSRFLIEENEGHGYVKKLIQVGSPNGGSEIPDMAGMVGGLLMTALNLDWKAKYAIKGLSFVLSKLDMNPVKTLGDLSTDSEMTKRLAKLPASGKTPYYLLAGNTNLIDEHDYTQSYRVRLLQALKEGGYGLMTTGVFKGKPNDIACTVESQRSISGLLETNVQEVASDHISYFGEDAVMEKLREIIG